MADKIDQIQIGSTSYDIDLPPDASPSIASLTVSGTTDVSAGTLKLKTVNAPTSSGGSTYGPGTSGYILTSNGTTTYWGAAPAGPSTYLKTASTSGNTLTLTKQDDTTVTYTPSFTDTNYYPIRSYTSGLQISSYSGSTNCQLYVPYGTASQYGVSKPAAVRSSAITSTTGGTTSGRYYGVEMDSNGKLFVNVPWSDASIPITDLR